MKTNLELLEDAAKRRDTVSVEAALLLELLKKADFIANHDLSKLGGDQQARLSLAVQAVLESIR